MSSKYPYFKMGNNIDGTNISFEQWTGAQSIGLHCHDFYELVIIDQGTCTHVYNGVTTLLARGDCVMIMPHKEHGYQLYGAFSAFNCQFFPESLNEDALKCLSRENCVLKGADKVYIDYPKDREKIITEVGEFMQKQIKINGKFEHNQYKQGVIHVNAEEYTFVRGIIKRGMDILLDDPYENLVHKRNCIEMILMEMQRALKNYRCSYSVASKNIHAAIAKILIMMEASMDEPFNFDEMATKFKFNPNYLRKAFREATGYSPVTYMNRMRILKAFSYMKDDKMNVKEAATMVGVFDENYFSRLFKKIIGVSPSQV